MSNSRTPSNRAMSSPRSTSRASYTAEGSNSVECSSPNATSNRRREIELKREIKRMEDEANYTFVPKSVTKKQFVNKDLEEDRFMTLYTNAKKRHIEQREEKLKQKLTQDLTFTPKFSTKASSRSNSRDRGQSIGDRLYNATPNKIKYCPSGASEDSQKSSRINISRSSLNSENTVSPLGTRSISSSRSNKSYQSDCSFTPTISKRAKSIDRSGSADRGFGDRLYSHSKIIQEKLEKVKAERDHKVAESCTFVPKTNNVTSTASPLRSSSTTGRMSSVTQKRINDRMKEFEENKTKKIEIALQAKLRQETAEATFKPQLVAKRLPTPLANIPVHERLSQPTEKDISDIESAVYIENTFHPQLIARRVSNVISPEYASATERLYQEGERKKKESEQERQQQLEDRYKEFTFSPKLGFGSKKKEKGGDEPEVPVFDRLASLNSRAFMDEILSKIKSEIELKDCTFQPKIPVTHAQSTTSCNKDEPVFIRLNKEAEIIRAEKIRREAEKIADELASATFSPCIPSSSIEIARRHMMYVHSEDEDVYSRLTKCSPKPSFDFESDSYDFDNESMNSSGSSLSRSKSGGLPEQEVDRIVQRLYSSHTKSSEKSLRISREENSEQIYEKKSNALPEKVLEKVFRRLSLTSPSSSSENNSSSFIDNPMSQSKHRRSISQGDSVLVYVPNGTGSDSNSPTKLRVPAAVEALNARSHFSRRTSTTPQRTSKNPEVAMTADESYSQYSCSSESKDFESELDQVDVVEAPTQTTESQQATNSYQPQPEECNEEDVRTAVVQSSSSAHVPAPERVLTDKKINDPNKLRRSSLTRNPPVVAEPSTPADKAQNAKPTKEFMSKIQKFSPSPAVSLSSVSIEEKIMAAAVAVGMTKIAGTAPSAAGPSLASLSSSSVAARTKAKSSAQTIASSHNQHQRAIQLTTSSQDIDDKWESNASKVLRGQKKKTEQAVPEDDDGASENNYGNIIMT